MTLLMFLFTYASINQLVYKNTLMGYLAMEGYLAIYTVFLFRTTYSTE